MSVSLTQIAINNLFNVSEYAIPIANQTASVAAEVLSYPNLVGVGVYGINLARRVIMNNYPDQFIYRSSSTTRELALFCFSLAYSNLSARYLQPNEDLIHASSIELYVAASAQQLIFRTSADTVARFLEILPGRIHTLSENYADIMQQLSLANIILSPPTFSEFASILTRLTSITNLTTHVILLLNLNSLLPILNFDNRFLLVDFDNIENNSRKILLNLLPKMEGGSFPSVVYSSSIGIDAGGLSRDLVTRLMGSLFHPNHPQLPTKPKAEKEQYVPIVDDQSKISRAEQLNCYRAIGGIFAAALEGEKSITTGSHLQPAIFHMLHSLTGNLLAKIPENFSSLEEIPKPILVKLIRAYVKAEMPTMPEEWLTRIFNDRFDDDFREMTGYESRDHFFQTIGFDKIAPAVLAIAEGMKKNLRRPWEQVKGASAEDLQRNIEGTLSVEEVQRAFGWPEANEAKGEAIPEENKDAQTLAFLKRWVNEASSAQLEDFAQAISGSRSLRPESHWTLQTFNEEQKLPSFHTCTPTIDLPNGYGSYEVFKAKLEMAIAESIAVAPQFI